jgi:hypothetical protein
MARYTPITGIDCLIPSLLIDTEAPLDVLYDTAAYRIRSVTQLVETLSLGDSLNGDNALLQDFARVIAIPLRDGCDLLDVIGRRLQKQTHKKNGRSYDRPFLYIHCHQLKKKVSAQCYGLGIPCTGKEP